MELLEGIISNYALQYQLLMDIMTSKQEDKSIQDFYAHKTILRDQTELIKPPDIQAIPSYIKNQET